MRHSAKLTDYLLRLVAIAALYFLTSLGVGTLAVTPGYAVPLFPSAGIGLAAVLAWGAGMAPGVWLGSLSFNLWLAWYGDALHSSGILASLMIATGAAVQAVVGARLVRAAVNFPSALDEMGPVLRVLVVGGPLACLISATVGVGSLSALGLIARNEFLGSWGSWWLGDTAGVIIGTPLLLPFFFGADPLWRRRWVTVSLPLAACLAFITFLYYVDTNLDRERIASDVRERAGTLARALSVRLNGYLDVLQASERFVASSERLDGDAFRRYSVSWIKRFPGLHAMGYLRLIDADERPALERRLKQEGLAQGIYDRDEVGLRFPAAMHGQYAVIVYAEPQPRNALAVGLNTGSLPASAQAVALARQRHQPVASESFILVQSPGTSSVAVYQPVEGVREPAMVYVAMRVEDVVNDAFDVAALDGLELCLFDASAPAGHQHLTGRQGCELEQNALGADYPLAMAGRDWRLRIEPTRTYLASQLHYRAPAAATGGVLAGGLLGVLLLVLSGRRRRVDLLVEERTAELHQANVHLRETVERLTVLGDNLPAGAVFQVAQESGGLLRLTFLSDGWRRLAGDSPEGIEEDDIVRLFGRLDPADRAGLPQAFADSAGSGEPVDQVVRLYDLADNLRWLHLRAAPRPSGERLLWDGILLDVTERKQADERIHFLVHFDPVTLLPNRTLFRDRCTSAISAAHRHGERLAVLLIDLDRFKEINDSLGHQAGDALLRETGRRLTVLAKDRDMVARLGGDEFALLYTDFHQPVAAAQFAKHVARALQVTFEYEGQQVAVGASIGIAVYPDDASDAETLMRDADLALLHARQSGAGSQRFFASDMNQRANERLALEAQLRLAINGEQLELFYQPQFDLAGQDNSGLPVIVGCEALLRWRRPLPDGRGQELISPTRFIPLAEESGLIIPLGDWVLQTACRQARAWRDSGNPLRVAVNVSAVQFRAPNFVDRLAEILGESGVPPRLLELELTESVLMEDRQLAVDRLTQLRRMGVLVAIDDFGTGYSSLAYLKRFPLDLLKIDRSFVNDLASNSDDAAIASAIVGLARSLKLGVVAEGVETREQEALLRALGCMVVQGFLYSQPLPVNEFESFCANWQGGRKPPSGGTATSAS